MRRPDTTFPFMREDGGWKVYVDGKKVEDFKALGTLIAFTVDAGEHDIEFRYHVPAFTAGLIMTIFALLALAACCFIHRKGSIKKALAGFIKPVEDKPAPAAKKAPEAEKASDEKPSEEKASDNKD